MQLRATTESLTCAGFWLGHPAAMATPRLPVMPPPWLAELQQAGRYLGQGLFADLAAARAAARHLQLTAAVHALWVPGRNVGRVQREVRGSGIAALLQRGHQELPTAAVAAGHDVVGFGGELLLSFVREDAGQQLCRELGLQLEPPPFLPDAATARRLCQELEDDDLGAPVRWLRCWRTVHSTLPSDDPHSLLTAGRI